MVGSWGRSEVGSAHLPTWSEDRARVLVRRWGSPVLRLAPHLPTRVWSDVVTLY